MTSPKKEIQVEEEVIKNLDLLLDLDTLEQEEVWDEALESNSTLNENQESL